MSAQRFSIGKQFRWNGILYEVKRTLPNSEINIEDAATGALHVVHLNELVAALFEDDLFFVVKGKHKGRRASKAQANIVIECADLSDYPDDVVAVARRRLEILEPLLALGLQCSLQDVFAAKHGRRAAKRHFKQYEQMAYPERPLQRVEIDNTPIDLIVVDEHDYLPLGRLNLTKALDTATRYPLGWYMGFEPPSYYSAMECLYHAICPKPDMGELYGTEHQLQGYGIPYSLVVDNGKEFIGQDLEDTCLLLGVILEYNPVRSPEFKAAIERHFSTCNGLFHSLPGTTFSNIFQRGDYDSVAQACITHGELEKMLHIFLVDIYAERFHKGLGGVPARRWEAAMSAGFSPRLPPSAQDLLILLGRVAYRKIQHYGIEFMNLRYSSSSLALLRARLNGEQAKIKYHPGDLSRLYVRDPFNDTYIVVPALASEYTEGLSLWKHRIVSAFARRHQDRVDLAALGRAKIKIQEVVDMAMSRKRRKSGKKLGRWQNSGQPPSLKKQNESTVTPTDITLLEDPVVESTPALPSPRGDDRELVMEELEEEGWGISYNLPRSGDSSAMNLEAATNDPK